MKLNTFKLLLSKILHIFKPVRLSLNKKSIDMKKSQQAKINQLVLNQLSTIKKSKVIFAEVRMIEENEKRDYPDAVEQRLID